MRCARPRDPSCCYRNHTRLIQTCDLRPQSEYSSSPMRGCKVLQSGVELMNWDQWDEWSASGPLACRELNSIQLLSASPSLHHTAAVDLFYSLSIAIETPYIASGAVSSVQRLISSEKHWYTICVFWYCKVPQRNSWRTHKHRMYAEMGFTTKMTNSAKTSYFLHLFK